jgi:hypothetical protein
MFYWNIQKWWKDVKYYFELTYLFITEIANMSSGQNRMDFN